MPGVYELERIGEPTTIVYLTGEQAIVLEQIYNDLGFESMVRLGHGKR